MAMGNGDGVKSEQLGKKNDPLSVTNYQVEETTKLRTDIVPVGSTVGLPDYWPQLG